MVIVLANLVVYAGLFLIGGPYLASGVLLCVVGIHLAGRHYGSL